MNDPYGLINDLFETLESRNKEIIKLNEKLNKGNNMEPIKRTEQTIRTWSLETVTLIDNRYRGEISITEAGRQIFLTKNEAEALIVALAEMVK